MLFLTGDRKFCALVGATVWFVDGNQAKDDGQSERMNQEPEKRLRCLVAQAPAQWFGNLIWVEYVHNSLPSVSTGFSPFQCVCGYQPPLFQALEQKVAVPSAMA